MGLASAGAMRSSSSSSSSLLSPEHRQQLNQTMDHLKAALIGFGMSKAKEFLTQAIPGIDQHLNESGQKFSRSHFADTGAGSNGSTWQHESKEESPGYRGTTTHDQPASFTPGMVP